MHRKTLFITAFAVALSASAPAFAGSMPALSFPNLTWPENSLPTQGCVDAKTVSGELCSPAG